MKRAVFIFSAAAMITACNTNPKTVADSANIIPSLDTAGLAEFRNWKQENEMMKHNEARNDVNYATAYEPAQKRTRAYYPVYRTSRSSSSYTRNHSVNNGGYRTSESGHTAKTVRRKRWSKAAKGAVIGAGSGAIIGAVVNKRNRAVGAVVGGVLGGGAGYVIGRDMDKRDGRY
jgi:thiamine pyrophosphate-dependent acetolactate synthase large subunit-like protein